jgi:hypothetical protein
VKVESDVRLERGSRAGRKSRSVPAPIPGPESHRHLHVIDRVLRMFFYQVAFLQLDPDQNIGRRITVIAGVIRFLSSITLRVVPLGDYNCGRHRPDRPCPRVRRN